MTFPSTYVYPICISNKNCLVFISLAIPTCPHGNRFKNQYFFYMLLQKKKKKLGRNLWFFKGLAWWLESQIWQCNNSFEYHTYLVWHWVMML
jgi:hypothetical protein